MIKKRLITILIAITLIIGNSIGTSASVIGDGFSVIKTNKNESEENINKDINIIADDEKDNNENEDLSDLEEDNEDLSNIEEIYESDKYQPGGAWELDKSDFIPDSSRTSGTKLGNESYLSAETLSQYEPSYDPRNFGKVTSIKNQGNWGMCWNYSAIATMESSLIAAGFENNNIDLSELHAAYFLYKTTVGTGSFSTFCNNGRDGVSIFNMAKKYIGPVTESLVPMQPLSDSITVNENYKYEHLYTLKNIYSVSLSESEKAKGYIKKYGGLSCSYFSHPSYYKDNPDGSGDTSYYFPYTGCNHEVEIIGWDDNYSAGNFIIPPPGNGAWLIKNSWGKSGYFSSNGTGYYWISYYDKSINTYPAVAVEFERNCVLSQSIAFQYSTLTIDRGTSKENPVIFTPDNTTNKKCDYVSSNPAIAYVDNSGKIIAINSGKCTITATTQDWYTTEKKSTSTCEITVPGISMQDISIDQNNYTIYEGQTLQLNPKAIPSNATNQCFYYESSDPVNIPIDGNGLIIAKGKSTSIIKIKSSDGSNITKEITVNVLKSHKLNYLGTDSINMKVDTVGVNINFNISELDYECENSLIYSCSAPDVVTINSVNSNGGNEINIWITAKKAGNAVLTVTLNEETIKTLTWNIYVEDTNLKGNPNITPPADQPPADQPPIYQESNTIIDGDFTFIRDKNSGTAELKSISGEKNSYKIPSYVYQNGCKYKVTSIAKYVFKNEQSLTSIIIPDTVENIGYQAFQGCNKLTKVVIGKNVKIINKRSFYNCQKLKNITIKSNKLQSVGANAFKKIYSKATIKVPKKKYKTYIKMLNKQCDSKVKINKF